ncbi:hypothetical protein K439DRAFT_1611853 [Ramaria rubella]|nr:hypothetical protein K439DRAFT_1611853 [Ramaria rubella]
MFLIVGDVQRALKAWTSCDYIDETTSAVDAASIIDSLISFSVLGQAFEFVGLSLLHPVGNPRFGDIFHNPLNFEHLQSMLPLAVRRASSRSQFSSALPILPEGLPPQSPKISTNFTIGTRVSYLNARTQQPETGTVTSTNDRLSDRLHTHQGYEQGTVIVTIQRDAGGSVQLPVAALQPA